MKSLPCPRENFMNNFRVHQCAPEEARSEPAKIAEENTTLGLLRATLFTVSVILEKRRYYELIENTSNRPEMLTKMRTRKIKLHN